MSLELVYDEVVRVSTGGNYSERFNDAVMYLDDLVEALKSKDISFNVDNICAMISIDFEVNTNEVKSHYLQWIG